VGQPFEADSILLAAPLDYAAFHALALRDAVDDAVDYDDDGFGYIASGILPAQQLRIEQALQYSKPVETELRTRTCMQRSLP
jgi:hypothetical protein